ncbi:efflux transporter periplasmic adaptor subunit, partial [Achromobacter xylosoxidans]|nr:efflux transporter periplasmic adaptor subunit [Achromobacter xylosoxidans]
MTMHTALSAFTRPALAVALSAACLLALALPGPALADAGHGQAPAGSDTRVAADSTATPQDHDEDKITLSPEQIEAADLGIETAGPARLETAAQFPGEIKFNADRTAHVVPRLAGVVQEVSADLG